MLRNNERMYKERIKLFLTDKKICADNRKFFKEFLEKEEYSLKRRNGLRKLDDGCYKTLYYYIVRFNNVNKWFKNKPLKDLTKDDFKKFYDDFEDGKILTKAGKPFEDRDSYYFKIFKSKPFKMLGKLDIVEEVMEFHQTHKNKEVRFIKEEEFKKIANVIINPAHKLLAWLAFDIGENVCALLQLRKKDCVRQIDKDTNIPEYRVNLRKETLKRSRTARSELTNHEETVELFDLILKDLKDDDLLFTFGYRNAKKFLDRAIKITKIKCEPKGEEVTWKDLRSSMACDLLVKGYSRDEVNARLGHRPSSNYIDKYINFLALDNKKPQRKVYEHNLGRLQKELEEQKQQNKLLSARSEKFMKFMNFFEENIANMDYEAYQKFKEKINTG